MCRIKKVIRTLEKLPKELNYKELYFNEYAKLGVIGIIEGKLHKNMSIYRSRINTNNDTFTSQNKISYPTKITTKFGRANCPGTTMFYGSYTPSISGNDQIDEAYLINAYEISQFLRDNDSIGNIKITIGKWVVKEDIQLVAIIFHPRFQNKTLLSQNLNAQFKKNLEKHPQFARKTKIWNKFISQEFAKEVDELNDNNYIISATYTEQLTSKGLDGLIYPTVKLEGRGFNIALTQKAVDDKLYLERVAEGRFYKNKLRTIMDWEKTCEVDNPNNFEFEDSPDKLGAKFCLDSLSKRQ